MDRPTDTWDGTGEEADDDWDVEWSSGPLQLDDDETAELDGIEDADEEAVAAALAAAREQRYERRRQARARLVRRRRRRGAAAILAVPVAVGAVLVARQLEQPSLTLAG